MPGEYKVPLKMAATFEAIVRLTDAVCRQHLDAEYEELARKMTAALARKRPSPLTRGGLPGWACGIVYTLGTVNFLFDKSQAPHMQARELCAMFGVSQSSGSARAREIEKMLRAGPFTPEWFRPSQMDQNPVAWLVETQDGLIVDARQLPRELQMELAEAGVIPFVPARSAETDTDELSSTRPERPATAMPEAGSQRAVSLRAMNFI